MLHLARAVVLTKLAAWAVFLLVFPVITYRNGMYAATVLLAVLGLLLDLTELGSLVPEAAPRAVRRGVIASAALLHVALLVAGAARVVFPQYGAWQPITGTDGWSGALLVQAPRGPIVAVGGAQPYVLGADGRFAPLVGIKAPVQPLGAGSRRVWLVGIEGRDAWGHDGASSIHVPLGRGFSEGRGLLRPVEGAAFDDALLLLRRETLVRVDLEGREEVVIERGVSSVAIDGARVIAVGARLHVSEDGGRSFVDRGPLPFKAPRVHAGGGSYYVVQVGVLSSELCASEGGGALEAREAPVHDVRELAVDPRDGRRLWLASWGEGVWSSEDGARTWRARGLEGLEIHALAARPGRTRDGAALPGDEVLAVGANLAVPAGIFRLAPADTARGR